MSRSELFNTTLAILAGGMGMRMGMPKVMLKLEGKPILAWLLDQFRWPGPTILVTAPAIGEIPGAELFGCRVSDPVDGLGPLRGVLTAMENLRTPQIVITTVDMPGFDRTILAWMVESLISRPDVNGVMCKIKRGEKSRIEPFPLALRATAGATIARHLAKGQLSVQNLCAEPTLIAIAPPTNWPADVWTNLNTPNDLAEFESTHKQHSQERPK